MRFYKYIIFVFLGVAVHGEASYAQVKTEAELVESLIHSLQTKDSRSYGDLFPGFDFMAQLIMEHADKESESFKRIQYLQNSYEARMDYDSSLKLEIAKNFDAFLSQGTKAGIHWDRIIFLRYELDKIREGRGLINEKIAPLRFLGYVFVKDQLTRRTYCFTVFDIMQIHDLWYGGELANIFEASTKDQFKEKLAAEKKRLRNLELGIKEETSVAKHHTTTEEEEDDDKPSSMKEVIDRKFYKGTFDNEIQVQLYVRHIKGGCPEVVCSWEALFKFGDQDEYVKMDVSRSADGSWLFSEDLGGMELKLKDNIYSGSYASSSDKTEYVVKFVETPIPPKKVMSLDEMLEFGMHGQ
jgi:hypothetical protein